MRPFRRRKRDECSVVYAERTLQAGAQGYINKHEGPKLLIEGIRRVMRGELVLSERMMSKIFR